MFRSRAPLLQAFTLVLTLTSSTFAQPPESPPPPSELAPPATPAPDSAAASPPPPSDPAPDSAAAADSTADSPSAPPPPAEEITVLGTRIARTPGSAHVITQRQLERFEYDDPLSIVQQVPGVYVRTEDGIGLRPNIGIRGANPDRSKKITLMEDGVLFGPAPYSAPAAYYFPLMTRMSQVRVIKGPSAIAYGPHTVGGAIDFISRPIPDGAKGSVDLAFGEYGYGKVDAFAGFSDEQKGFLIEGVRLWNTGFKELPSGADTGSTRNDWTVKASYVLDPRARERNEFSMKLAYADEVSNESYLGLTDADLRADPYQRYAASALDQMKNHRFSLVLSHHFDSRRLKIETSAYRHDYARVWRKLNRFEGTDIASVLRAPDDPVNRAYLEVLKGGDAAADAATGTGSDMLWIGPNDRTFVSEGIQSVSTLSFDGPVSQRIELGIRIHHDQIARHHSESAFVMTGGNLVPANTATLYTAFETADSYALAMHVLDALTWHDLTLTPGVRVELIRSTLDDELHAERSAGFVPAVMPGVGAFYGFTPSFGVLAGVYRGFSPPPPAPTEETKPEYSVNYEGGLRYSKGKAHAEVIGFFNDYSNMTDVCTFATGCIGEDLDRQYDAGAAHIYGLEAYAAHEVPIADFRLPLNVSYTFTRGTFQNSFQSADPIYDNVQKGDEIPYIPRHQLSASIGLERGRTGAAIAANYVSSMREEAGSQPLAQALATDEQFWIDVSARVGLWGPLSIYANVRNLLNDAYIVSRRPFGARPNAPRWVQVGLKLEL